MWFLKHRPSKISVQALVKSLDKGYQQTSYSIKLDGAVKMFVAIPYPFAPHKDRGSFKLIDESLFSKVGSHVLTESDITLYSRARDLKKLPDLDLFNLQELSNWYIEDFGFITFWAEPEKVYQINYMHKIASDSQLFVPTRLPTLVMSGKPEISFSLSIIGANLINIPEWLKLETSKNDAIVKGNFQKWNWDLDTRFNTFNWESSDDEAIDSE